MRNSKGSLDVAQSTSVHTQKPGTSHKRHRKRIPSYVNQNYSMFDSKPHSSFSKDHPLDYVPKVFKDMNIHELNRHKNGILNIYKKGKRKPTGNFTVLIPSV